MEPKKSKNSKNSARETAHTEPSVIVHKRSWAWPLVTVIIFFGLVLIAAMLAAAIWGNRYGYHMRDGRYQAAWMTERTGWHGLFDSQNRVAGVVTAVSADSFTIAGNGGAKNITTTSSTQYQGGNKVKINDTVIVYGKTSGNSLQASFIVINP